MFGKGHMIPNQDMWWHSISYGIKQFTLRTCDYNLTFFFLIDYVVYVKLG